MMTTEQRATRALVCLGKPPAILRVMSESEIGQVAGLVDDDGHLVEGAADKHRQIMIDYYEARKATNAEHDEPNTER